MGLLFLVSGKVLGELPRGEEEEDLPTGGGDPILREGKELLEELLCLRRGHLAWEGP